ncbi:hypothetical protein GO730_00350 [Spirosoma sp. HMF3257]|uniref:Uncharacterized protein n=1 Tax=Spirosoma telluris TaxID=2183553 RepID=A0A327NET9_9BACT|nr:hypothetical protein [Spirosoma telluris]RAI73253.1 hypothetical protein HMF3257_00335 [Spirosoma telluris]
MHAIYNNNNNPISFFVGNVLLYTIKLPRRKITFYKERTEITKNSFEVTAILVSGIWVFGTFILTQNASLGSRNKTESSLNIFKISDGRESTECGAQFKVKFENIGYEVIEIEKVRLRVFIFWGSKIKTHTHSRSIEIDDIIKYPDSIICRKVYTKLDFVDGKFDPPFIQKYAPGTSSTHGFDFIVNKVEGKWICFIIELYEEKVNPEKGER